VDSLNGHVRRPANLLGAKRLGEGLPQFGYAAAAGTNHLAGDLIRHFGGRRAGPRREREDVDPRKSRIAADAERIFQCAVRFSWESHNDVGRDGRVGQRAADALDGGEKFSASIRPIHAGQNRIVA